MIFIYLEVTIIYQFLHITHHRKYVFKIQKVDIKLSIATVLANENNISHKTSVDIIFSEIEAT